MNYQRIEQLLEKYSDTRYRPINQVKIKRSIKGAGRKSSRLRTISEIEADKQFYYIHNQDCIIELFRQERINDQENMDTLNHAFLTPSQELLEAHQSFIINLNKIRFV